MFLRGACNTYYFLQGSSDARDPRPPKCRLCYGDLQARDEALAEGVRLLGMLKKFSVLRDARTFFILRRPTRNRTSLGWHGSLGTVFSTKFLIDSEELPAILDCKVFCWQSGPSYGSVSDFEQSSNKVRDHVRRFFELELFLNCLFFVGT